MIALDKQAHFWAGLAICLAAGLMASPVVALIAGVSAGILKEFWDALGNGTPDLWDAVATALGAAVGFGLMFVFP